MKIPLLHLDHVSKLLKLGKHICAPCGETYVRQVSTSGAVSKFWEPHIKGEYRKKDERKIPSKKEVTEGFQLLKKEAGVWRQEVWDKFAKEPLYIVRPGEMDTVFKFDSEQSLNRWVVSTDKDNGEGSSTAELVIGPNGKAVLRGTIDTNRLKDGATQRTGYANMRCVRPRRSFLRDSFFDWTQYTHLVVRLRGDGRSYMLNLSSMGYYDMMWNDVYSFPLYTRGGPYWQVSKIPFSRFFLTGKGRVQDKQCAVDKDRVTHVGITCAGIAGHFQLEIDYIGVEFDPKHDEHFAYEMYQTPSFVAGV